MEGLTAGGMAAFAGAPSFAAHPGFGLCPDDLPDGLVVADRDGRVIVFNRAATRLTGVAAVDALGGDVRGLLPLADSDGRDWWARVDPYDGLQTRTRHPEMSLFLPGGTELLVTVGYARRRPGRPDRVVLMLRGTEHRDRLERSRADLVSTVAHELRSPLTSVKGFTATLLAKWGKFTDDQKRIMLETVNADADRVTRLITELLDVSRIESGRMEIHRQLVDIPDRVAKIIAGRVAAGDSPGRFQVLVTSPLPETWLDADKVDQILGNLIENALRHGAGTVTVVVEPAGAAGPRATGPAGQSPAPQSAGPEGAGAGAVAIRVRDEGDGIAPELAPRVFRQFWRGKRHGGAGLGLFIVKGLVEAHGGTISVHRAPGGGAEFRFNMPAGTPDFG